MDKVVAETGRQGEGAIEYWEMCTMGAGVVSCTFHTVRCRVDTDATRMSYEAPWCDLVPSWASFTWAHKVAWMAHPTCAVKDLEVFRLAPVSKGVATKFRSCVCLSITLPTRAHTPLPHTNLHASFAAPPARYTDFVLAITTEPVLKPNLSWFGPPVQLIHMNV